MFHTEMHSREPEDYSLLFEIILAHYDEGVALGCINAEGLTPLFEQIASEPEPLAILQKLDEGIREMADGLIQTYYQRWREQHPDQ